MGKVSSPAQDVSWQEAGWIPCPVMGTSCPIGSHGGNTLALEAEHESRGKGGRYISSPAGAGAGRGQDCRRLAGGIHPLAKAVGPAPAKHISHAVSGTGVEPTYSVLLGIDVEDLLTCKVFIFELWPFAIINGQNGPSVSSATM